MILPQADFLDGRLIVCCAFWRAAERVLVLAHDCIAAIGISFHWHMRTSTSKNANCCNSAVDRVLKAFNRFLSQCEQEYGIPESIAIETTKESFSSVAFGRTLDYERRQRRDKDNQMRAAIREDMRKQLSNGGSFKVHDYDIRRWEIVQSQNNTCLYCGATSPRFSFDKSELDHIVPRRGVGSLAKLSKISLAQFLHYLARLRESRRLQYSSGVTVPQFGALNIAHLERVMFENGFRFRDGSLNTADLTMLGNNRDGSPTGKNMVNAHDVVSGHPVFSGARRKSLLVARRKRLLEELAGVEVELASLG